MDENAKPQPDASDSEPTIVATVGGRVDRVRVGLRFFGDSLVPDELTRLLGCQPDAARRKGDPIPNNRHNPIAKTGSWLLDSPLPQTTEINEQLAALFGMLTNDLDVWHRLTKEFKTDVFCGVFLEICNRGFHLSPSTMAMLSQRGLEIGFDIYCP